MNKYLFEDIVIGDAGLLKGPFGSDLKKSLYVPKGKDTYKVYLQENILQERNDVGTYYISKEYYDSKMKRYAIKENDFIVTCDGTLGEIYQLKNVTEKGIISSSLLKITLNPEVVDYDYFYYYFKFYIKKSLTTKGNNSVLKHLPGINIIKKLEIELPDLTIQKQVGKILKTIDDKIKINKQMNFELENLTKIIYDYWFLQFEFPNQDGKPYKLSGGKMVWNNEAKKEIPKNWNVSKIGALNIYISDFTANGSFAGLRENVKYNSGEPYSILVRPIDFNNNFDKDFVYVNKSAYDYLKKSNLNCDDLIICNVGNVGAVYRCPDLKMPMTLGPNGIVIRSKNLDNYLYEYFKSDIGYNALLSISSGSIQKKFNKTSFKELNLIIPCDDVIDKYNLIYETLYNLYKNNWVENRELISLKNYLLPLLMNGQVGFKG